MDKMSIDNEITSCEKLVCVFCYKSFEYQCYPNGENGEKIRQCDLEIQQRFYNILARHLNFNLVDNKRTELQALLAKSCFDCFGIIKIYCQLYHEIKCLELRLNWQTEKLWRVMRAADKVPSRVKVFREWVCGKSNEKGNVARGDDEQLEGDSTDDNGKDENLKKAVIKFRQGLKRQCKRFLSQTYPRVSVTSVSPTAKLTKQEDTNASTTFSSTDESRHFVANEERLPSKVECFLGWMTSFVTVVFLFHLQIPIPVECPENKDMLPKPLMNNVHTQTDSVDHPLAEMNLEEEDPPEEAFCEVETDSFSNLSVHNESSDVEMENGVLPDDNVSFSQQSVKVYNNSSKDGNDNAQVDFPDVCQKQEHNISDYQKSPLISQDQWPLESGTQELYEGKPLPSSISSPPLSPLSIKHEIALTQPKTPHNFELHSGDTEHSVPEFVEDTPEVPIVLETSVGSQPVVKADMPMNDEKDALQQKLAAPKISTIIDASEPSPTKRRSLRQIFKCEKCHATFTCSNRLEIHVTDFHCESESSLDGSSDEKEGNTGIGEDEYMEEDNDSCIEIDSESDSSESYLSEKEEDQDLKEEVVKIKNNVSCDSRDQRVRISTTLFHERYFKTNGRFEIDSNYLHGKGFKMQDCNLENFPSDTRHHPCTFENCSKMFALPQELENHYNLYHTQGKFNCHICDLTMTTAIDLIDHELEHSDSKWKEEDENSKQGKQFFCARCNEEHRMKLRFVNHYLGNHLKLSRIDSTCPICKQIFPHADQVPLVHYVNFHDLARLDDPTKPFRCTDSDCSAYFLTEDQLHVHWNKFHQTSTKLNKVSPKKDAEQYPVLPVTAPVTFPCPHCSQIFRANWDLKRHIWRIHRKDANNKPLNGRHGKLVISSPEQGLTLNDFIFDKKTKYFCSIKTCKKGFLNEEDLTSHSRLHGEFKCNFCDVVKTYAPNLALHETIHKLGKVDNQKNQDGKRCKNGYYDFSCMRCSFKTCRRQLYVEHHVETHLELTMDKQRCPICKFIYGRQYYDDQDHYKRKFKISVFSHYAECHDIRAENGVSPKEIHKCTQENCSAYFLTSIQLDEHILNIHENIPRAQRHRCKDCGINFSRAGYLFRHRSKHHKMGEQDFRFVCEVAGCGLRFDREIHLHKHHQHSHSNGKVKHDCVKCGKAFLNIGALKTHLRLSHGKRMYICDECGRKFITETYLNFHMVTHRRPPKSGHVCEECGKVFPFIEKLAQHKQFHAGPETWKFSCSVCNKKVLTQQKLDEHMRTHTKEKPFVCQICGVAYAHRHNLRIHVNNKHGVQDIPRKMNKVNMASSRKGKKLK